MTRRLKPRQNCGCRLCPGHTLLRDDPPLWVKALEAWTEYEYPLGSPGRSAVLRVVDQVRKHVRRGVH